jgi:D-inositol-3-phosphate glycosyltransferase
VEAADRLVANTGEEADQLAELYGADPERVAVVPPGVDLDRFTPGLPSGRRAARENLGIPPDAKLLLFVGRIQPLKAPDVLVRATARLLARRPALRASLVVAVVGGPSGTGLREPESLTRLVAELGLEDVVRFAPPAAADRLVDWYRAADLVAVPSYSESFGLVALEAQACGTPVVAAGVGGLRETVADGLGGVLVPDHDPDRWADVLGSLLDDEPRRLRLAAGALTHAARYSWDATVDGLLEVYARVRSAPRRLEVEPPLAAVDVQP